jgi:hypothetical protein
VNIIDEDISAPECERLRAYGIHFRQIGAAIGRLGMKDREDILPLLHRLKRPTLYIRRLLRHSEFRTQAQRMGKVARVRHTGVSYWQIQVKGEQTVSW